VRVARQEDALGQVRSRAKVNRGVGHCGVIMANRRTNPKELPEAVRETLDELVKSAGAGAGVVRERVRGALEDLEERRPATQDDISALRKELRALGRRLDAIEERLPAQKRPASARGSGSKAKPKAGNRNAKVAAARSAAAQRSPAKRSQPKRGSRQS